MFSILILCFLSGFVPIGYKSVSFIIYTIKVIMLISGYFTVFFFDTGYIPSVIIVNFSFGTVRQSYYKAFCVALFAVIKLCTFSYCISTFYDSSFIIIKILFNLFTIYIMDCYIINLSTFLPVLYFEVCHSQLFSMSMIMAHCN